MDSGTAWDDLDLLSGSTEEGGRSFVYSTEVIL